MVIYILFLLVPLVSSCNESFFRKSNTTLDGIFFEINTTEPECFKICSSFNFCSGIIYRKECLLYSSDFYHTTINNTEYFEKRCIAVNTESSYNYKLIIAGIILFIMCSCIFTLYGRQPCIKKKKNTYDPII